MSRLELDRVFNNTAMKKRCVVPSSRDGCNVYCTDRLIACMQRTHRFGIVAMSPSSLFDISHPTDCLRSALYVLTEYEQAKEENDRSKMVKASRCLALCLAYSGVRVATLETVVKTAGGHGRHP